MNREIKFRAFYRGEMYNVQEIYFDEGKVYANSFKGHSFSPDSEHVKGIMQFTGLKDKNGKEIYEGDIVRSEYGVCYLTKMYPCFVDNTQRIEIFEVKYNTNDACFEKLRQPNDNNFDYRFEVIGNVFENKNLLEK